MRFYDKFSPLLTLTGGDYHVYALTGGRGSLKTGHAIRSVLIDCLKGKRRACFFRETKDTLNESVKAEIENVIFEEFSNRGFIVKKENIRNINGSYIFFKGLKEVNRAAIENLKGIASNTDIFVVDEAQTVSKAVWDVLLPTLRKAGSVLIVIYNRIAEDLPVEEALFLNYEEKKGPAGTFFLEVNYPEVADKGFLSEQFLQRAALLKQNKPAEYEQFYLNIPKKANDNAVVRYFTKENIVEGLYCPDLPIHLTCDFNVGSMAWGIFHTDEERKKFSFIEEICVANTNTADCIGEFLRRYPAHKERVIVNGDASGRSRKTSATFSDYAIIMNALADKGYEADLDVSSFNPPIMNRVQAFNQMVMDEKGKRHLFVHSKCKEILNAMKNLCFKIGTNLIETPTPKQLEANDKMLFAPHIFDAVSYPAQFYNPIEIK